MLNIKKDKVSLLKAVDDLVSDHLSNASINPNLEAEVADFILEFTDKKRLRRLKLLQKELRKWIKELDV